METLNSKKLYTKLTGNHQHHLAINSNQASKDNSISKVSSQGNQVVLPPSVQNKENSQSKKEDNNLKSYFNLKESQNQEQVIDQYLTDVYKSKFVNEKKVRNCPPEKEELKNHFSEFRINDNSMDPLVYFERLSQQVLSKTTHCGSPLMIGHMSTSLPFFQRPLSKMLTSLNQNTVKVETSSYLTFLERETLAKLHHAFYKLDKAFYMNNVHNPETSLGTFTSGGTLANLTALWVARNLKLPKSDGNFGGIEKEGLFRALKFYGYSDICFIGSEMVHYSFKKAADILGMGTQGLVTIPSDENYCMKVDLLEEKLKELKEKKVCVIAVIGIAGATETGSIDNLKGIATVCKKYDVHFHVDGAWGGPMIFSSIHGQKLKGIELADSITVDAHKQLYTPVGCGVVLFKDPKSAVAIRKTANYIIRLDSMDLGKYSPEGSRPANVVYLHASLSILGTKGLDKAMNHGCEMVEYMKKSLKNHNEFEVLFEPMMNILLYRWIPVEYREKIKKSNKPSHLVLTKEDNEVINEKNCFLQKLLAHQGESFVSRTTVNSVKYSNTPISCLRVVITNPLTETKHIDQALQEQLRFIKELEISTKSSRKF